MTKDYPDDCESRLDRPDAFRLNVGAGSTEFERWAGHSPREPAPVIVDRSLPDVVFPHPVYGSLGWLCIVNPGPRTELAARELLRTAHHLARNRFNRRAT